MKNRLNELGRILDVIARSGPRIKARLRRSSLSINIPLAPIQALGLPRHKRPPIRGTFLAMTTILMVAVWPIAAWAQIIPGPADSAGPAALSLQQTLKLAEE